ncbi:MAG: PA14 domain-containing protein [Saprospiraceae bacterium]|nr:PA14 domain-containing protein [Saprospiraceae bacterium]MDZ4702874.1 PA14 domain-containing protein [Saprospiraceae bacterium]
MKKIVWMLALACAMGLASGQSDQGLVGEYYDGMSFNNKKMTRTDAQISFFWNNVAPAKGMDPERFSIRWKGKIKAPERGSYIFRAYVDDGIRVKVDGKMVINAWGLHDSERFTGSVWLEAGRYYDLQVDYFNGMLEGEIQLYWQLPSEAIKTPDASGHRDELIASSYFGIR